MSPKAKEVLDAALALPDADKTALAEALLSELAGSVDPAVEAAWKVEVQKRSEAHHVREPRSIRWEDLKREL